MKKVFTAVMMAVLCSTCMANLIKNGDFDDEKINEEYRKTGVRESSAFSIFTEDLTWNKCGKLDFIRYNVDKDSKKSYGSGIIIGGKKGLAGFPVEGGATYKFSLEMKGTVKRAFVHALYWVGECRYYKDRKKLKSTVGIVKVQKDWVTYKGTFTLPKDAKRAALLVSIWGSEQYNDLPDEPGQHLLIDKIEIKKTKQLLPGLEKKTGTNKSPVRKKKGIVAKAATEEPQLDGKLNDPQWKNAHLLSGFYEYKGMNAAVIQTSAKVLATANALWIAVTCNEPEMDLLKAANTEAGKGNVWKDDNIEIFIDNGAKNRVLNQFVVSAGGGRWMGWGKQRLQPGPNAYQNWDAKVSKNDSGWTAEIRIPYTQLGWGKKPEIGTTAGLNICRQRLAGKTELSCWNPVKGNFHNKDKFGVLAFSSLNRDAKNRLQKLKHELDKITDLKPEFESVKKKLAEQITKWKSKINSSELTESDWEAVDKMLVRAKDDIVFLRLSNQTFAVTAISPSAGKFSIPLLPEGLSEPKDKIEVKAAVNEYESLPIAITNLTDKYQDYRIILCSGIDNGIEIAGMKSKTGAFPANQLKIRQGVRVKDSEAKQHGQQFDPLPEIGQAGIITIPPKDSGLIWITFNCTDVKPDTYKAFLRVIPLNESAKFINVKGKGWQYKGAIKDVPVELTIWPIKLAKTPQQPLWLMRKADNELFFKNMITHGNRVFQFSTWSFKMSFNPDGSVKNKDFSLAEKALKDHRNWAKKYDVDIQYLIGFSAYLVFNKVHAKNQFNYGSGEWKNAWQNWLKAINQFFLDHNVGNDDFCIEIWDEPHLEDAEKVIQTCKLAHDACPSMKSQITFGASRHSFDTLSKLLPSVAVWCFWGSYFDDKKMTDFIKNLQADKSKQVWMYFCNTSLRVSLYRYYRLFAWKGLFNDTPILGLFNYLPGPGGYYGRASWKYTAGGAVCYNTCNTPIPSIRYECLREGIDDVKYLVKLKEVVTACKQKGIDNQHLKEAEQLLKTAPFLVVEKENHNTEMAEKIRKQAANLILKLQN